MRSFAQVAVAGVAAAAMMAGLAAPAGAIVNGIPASIADYPFFAEIGSGCGGALIMPRRVLTAAHCTEVLNESERVRVGPDRLRRTVLLRAILPLHVRELDLMEREFPPPAGDLMILMLDRPVRGVPLARIASPQQNLTAAGTPVTTIGRGVSDPDGSGGGIFRTGSVEIQPQSDCADELSSPLLRAWSLCTRDPRMANPFDQGPFVSACFGDSGGPLLAGSPDRVVGVVSWGPNCGVDRDPELYANVVRGRSFALVRKPVWAPKAFGRGRITGRTVVGRAVRCSVRWRVKPTRQLSFLFVVDGRMVADGRRPVYRLRPSDRGGRISCDAGGKTAGGRGGTPALARPRLVR